MSSVWCMGQQRCTVTLMERMFCILVHSTCTIMEASHLDAMITTVQHPSTQLTVA